MCRVCEREKEDIMTLISSRYSPVTMLNFFDVIRSCANVLIIIKLAFQVSIHRLKQLLNQIVRRMHHEKASPQWRLEKKFLWLEGKQR